MPAAVHVATVPAAPKSTSSGWATITSARCTSSSSSTSLLGAVASSGSAATVGKAAVPARRPYRVPDGTLRPQSATGTIEAVDATPLWRPPIDPETPRAPVAGSLERDVRHEPIPAGITEVH